MFQGCGAALVVIGRPIDDMLAECKTFELDGVVMLSPSRDSEDGIVTQTVVGSGWQDRLGEHRSAVVQASPLPGRHHPALRVVVLPLQPQFPRCGGDDSSKSKSWCPTR